MTHCICGAEKWPTAMYCLDCDRMIPHAMRVAILISGAELRPGLWLSTSAHITASPSFQARTKDYGRYQA